MCAFEDIFESEIPENIIEHAYGHFVLQYINNPPRLDLDGITKVQEYFDMLIGNMDRLNDDIENNVSLNYKACIYYIKWLTRRYDIEQSKEVIAELEKSFEQNYFSDQSQMDASLNKLINLCILIHRAITNKGQEFGFRMATLLE